MCARTGLPRVEFEPGVSAWKGGDEETITPISILGPSNSSGSQPAAALAVVPAPVAAPAIRAGAAALPAARAAALATAGGLKKLRRKLHAQTARTLFRPPRRSCATSCTTTPGLPPKARLSQVLRAPGSLETAPLVAARVVAVAVEAEVGTGVETGATVEGRTPWAVAAAGRADLTGRAAAAGWAATLGWAATG